MSLLLVKLTTEIHWCWIPKKAWTNGHLLCLVAHQSTCCPPDSFSIACTYSRVHADIMGLLTPLPTLIFSSSWASLPTDSHSLIPAVSAKWSLDSLTFLVVSLSLSLTSHPTPNLTYYPNTNSPPDLSILSLKHPKSRALPSSQPDSHAAGFSRVSTVIVLATI